MKIVEKICDTQPHESDILQFEAELDVKLPESYKAFLITHNGGRPKPSKISFTAKNGKLEDSPIQYFFGLHNGRIASLRQKFGLYKNRIPKDFLSVATDSFGNLILMNVGNQSNGKIFFWDHEREEDLPPLNNISFVANSFEDFVDALKE